LDRKLPSILNGKAEPKNPAEGCELARLCGQFQKRYAAALLLFEKAFAADAKLANDLAAGHRYNAACYAALAAAGRGKGAAKLDDKERARLRRQALTWLQADLRAHGKQLKSSRPEAANQSRQALRHWQGDADLASVRDRAALARLPETERADWQKLWADVEALLKTAAPKAE
jgi:hypothetical protein